MALCREGNHNSPQMVLLVSRGGFPAETCTASVSLPEFFLSLFLCVFGLATLIFFF